MLTAAVLEQVCPRLSVGQRGVILPALLTAMDGSSLTTAARLAAFLAQCAHESGEFRLFQEIWGPTVAQKRYEPPSPKAAELGNTEPGDGHRFRGRGAIQITGRANYRTAGQRLGLPLETAPDLASEAGIGCLVAIDFWDSRHLSAIADIESRDSFARITRRINGALRGQPERERYHALARSALGLPRLTVPSDAQ